jgi:hypothetical protein
VSAKVERKVAVCIIPANRFSILRIPLALYLLAEFDDCMRIDVSRLHRCCHVTILLVFIVGNLTFFKKLQNEEKDDMSGFCG